MAHEQWIERYRQAWETADEGEITLPGRLLLRFAPDGRCQDLWEYWQVAPGRLDPPAGKNVF